MSLIKALSICLTLSPCWAEIAVCFASSELNLCTAPGRVQAVKCVSLWCCSDFITSRLHWWWHHRMFLHTIRKGFPWITEKWSWPGVCLLVAAECLTLGDWTWTEALHRAGSAWAPGLGFQAPCPHQHASCLEMLGRHQRQHSDKFTYPCHQGTALLKTACTILMCFWNLIQRAVLCDSRNQIAMPRFFFPEWQLGSTPGKGKPDPRKYLGSRVRILHHLFWRWLVFPTERC